MSPWLIELSHPTVSHDHLTTNTHSVTCGNDIHVME